MKARECDHCHEPIECHGLIVPKMPKGAYHFHSDGICRAAATRRATTVFPNVSGKRGRRIKTA